MVRFLKTILAAVDLALTTLIVFFCGISGGLLPRFWLDYCELSTFGWLLVELGPWWSEVCGLVRTAILLRI